MITTLARSSSPHLCHASLLVSGRSNAHDELERIGSMSEQNKAIVRRMIDEILNGQGNLDVADELFAPYYVGHNPASPQDTRGPEGVKEFASMFRSAFPDVHFSVEDQVAEGDKVVTRWRGSGTHQGDFLASLLQGSALLLSALP